jgi:adenosylhomocysteine nucleosidase
MTRVAILAAMADELKPLVRGWQHERRNGVDLWRWGYDEGEWVAACAGAGVGAVTRAFAEVEKDGLISFVFSTGWAGALRRDIAAGKSYAISGVVDSLTGERFSAALWSEERLLVTSPKVANKVEKRRLASTYNAALVDMEAAAVARLASMRGIPFYCLKGVSDAFDDNLPDFNRFIATSGQFQLAQFIVFCLFRPGYWPSLMRMGENSSKAAKAIRGSLLEILDGTGVIRKRNGYPNRKR